MGKPASLGMDVIPPRDFQGRVDFRKVHFTYPARPDKPVFSGLDLTLPAGKVTALVRLLPSLLLIGRCFLLVVVLSVVFLVGRCCIGRPCLRSLLVFFLSMLEYLAGFLCGSRDLAKKKKKHDIFLGALVLRSSHYLHRPSCQRV